MKKCFIMFVFLIVMLFVAAISDNAHAMISENGIDNYAEAEMALTSDDIKNNSREANYPR